MKGRHKSGLFRIVLAVLLLLIGGGFTLLFSGVASPYLNVALIALGAGGLLFVWYVQTCRATESLAQNRERLLGVAFHHSGEAIMITDHDNCIVTVNPAFTELTGYTQEEVVGKNPSMLSAGRTTREEYERMWAAISLKGYWQGEIWDRRKDGGVYPKWLSISVMRDESGEIRFHIAHFSDISAERGGGQTASYGAPRHAHRFE